VSELHESWLRLVYGPKRSRLKKHRTREPRLTDPVERVSVPFPHRRKYFHRDAPDVVRSLKATRHDRDAVKQLIRQKPEVKIYLRVSKVTLKPIEKMSDHGTKRNKP